jgi:hypothetical protein
LKVLPDYFYEDPILRKSREERQRYNLLTSLRSSEDLREEEQLRHQLGKGAAVTATDSIDPTAFPVYYKHPRKLWLRDLLFLIQSENDPVFMQLSKCWEDSDPEVRVFLSSLLFFSSHDSHFNF